jgi:PAS domain S-box-containing protein
MAIEHQHSFRALRSSLRFLENRAQANVVKRDREFMLRCKTLDQLLSFACAHASRPHPRELRIVNSANLLSFQFSFDQVGKLAHQGATSCVQLCHLIAIGSVLGFKTSRVASLRDKLRRRKECSYSIVPASAFLPFDTRFLRVRSGTRGALFQVMNKTKLAAGHTPKSNGRHRNGANGARHDGTRRKTRNSTHHAEVGSTNFNLAERKGTLAFQHSESRYQALFDLVPVAVYVCDANGVIEEYNQRAADLWGCEPGRNGSGPRFCGSHKIYYPDGRFMPHEKCPMAKALRGEELVPEDLEIIVERPDGERRHVIPAPQILRDDRGKIVGAINCLYDITERKKTEQLLAEAARQQSALYELVQRRQQATSVDDIYNAALDAIISALLCDRASILLFDSKGMMRFVAWRGLSEQYRKAVEGHSPWKADSKNPQPICIGDVDLADLPKPLKATIRRERIHAAAFIPLVGKRKLIGKFMTYYNEPHAFSDSEISLAVTIARQLTHGIEHKKGDEALRESEGRLRAIVEQTTAGMARADLQGRLLYVNERFCKMLGYKPSELLGKPIRELTHPQDQNKSGRLFRRLASEAKAYEMEKRYLRKNGTTLWVNISASPVLDAKNKPNSAVAVVFDITSRKKAEAELQRSKELLENLMQKRTKALRSANAELENEIRRRKGLEGQILEISDREQERLGQELHDGLCQQLTAIGFLARATALRLKDHRVVQTEDLEKIAQLINSSVMDARNIARDLHKEEIDAPEFPMALRALVERKIWKTPCRLELKTEVSIEDDKVASQLYRILREAVINANKHARATQIVLEVRQAKNDLVFCVTDNGVGISRKPRAGQGLGFHIMQYRAQSIGARLEFESPKKGGSRVACYLPLSVIK